MVLSVYRENRATGAMVLPGCQLHGRWGGGSALPAFSLIAPISLPPVIWWKNHVKKKGMAMYQALYRKWRPRDFDEVVGQAQVTDILKYQVKEGRVSHAYLFCGSRGTGKTSCAKIMAKAVNCLSPVGGNPCHACEACRSIERGTAVDVIEMDAASNNGVDHVRDLKEEITYTPASLRYRVYIIDEVHMMTGSAFNALLKTLEEPPAHALFILATTELRKLPATIISRCQRFDFHRLTTTDLMGRMRHISSEEGISLTDEGARMIARMAQGGMRDAISLLELCAASGQEITPDVVSDLLGCGSTEDIYQLVKAISTKEYSTIYAIIDKAEKGGTDISTFWQELGNFYRQLMVVSVLPEAQAYLDITEHEYSILRECSAKLTMPVLLHHTKLIEETAGQMQRPGISKRIAVELALTRMCDSKLSKDTDALLRRIDALEREVAQLKAGAVPMAQAQAPASTPTPQPSSPPKAETKPQSAPRETPKPSPAPVRSYAEQGLRPVRNWREVLSTIEGLKPHYAPTFRMAKAALDGAGHLQITLPSDVVGNMIKNDAVVTQLILGLVCENDPTCDASGGVTYVSVAMSAPIDDFSF